MPNLGPIKTTCKQNSHLVFVKGTRLFQKKMWAHFEYSIQYLLGMAQLCPQKYPWTLLASPVSLGSYPGIHRFWFGRPSPLLAESWGRSPSVIYWKFALGLLGLEVRLTIFTIWLKLTVIFYEFEFNYSLPSV